MTEKNGNCSLARAALLYYGKGLLLPPDLAPRVPFWPQSTFQMGWNAEIPQRYYMRQVRVKVSKKGVRASLFMPFRGEK